MTHLVLTIMFPVEIKIVLPHNLTYLTLEYKTEGLIKYLQPVKLPATLKTFNLVIGGYQDRCFTFSNIFGSELPPTLERLSFDIGYDISTHSNDIVYLDMELPETLKALMVSKFVSIRKFPELPVGLEFFRLNHCRYEEPIEYLPQSLRFLEIDECEYSLVEKILEKLPYGLEFLSIKSTRPKYNKQIISLPPGLKYLGCELEAINWSELPDTLRIIDLRQYYKDTLNLEMIDITGPLAPHIKWILCRPLQCAAYGVQSKSKIHIIPIIYTGEIPIKTDSHLNNDWKICLA